MPERRRRDPSKWSPREAKERFLRRRQNDSAKQSVESYHGRLKLFVEWCESVGIGAVGDLVPYDVNEYFDLRSGDVAPHTVRNEMHTLRQFCQFLEQLGAVDDGLAEKVPIPSIDYEEQSSDSRLATDDALALIDYHRQSEDAYGTRAHVLLELAWFIGARQGGLRALDLRDVYMDENCVEFHHRPDTETPLKNKSRGERTAGVPEETMNAISRYVSRYRYDVRDDHGRQPLLASRYGRPINNTVRVWTYLATLPCTYGECPHGKERDTCTWTGRNHASKCPSSRSPHQIRTGSITWQLNSNVPVEVVAARVNAEPKTIEQHYDKPSPDELWQRRRDQMQRRRDHLSRLMFNNYDT